MGPTWGSIPQSWVGEGFGKHSGDCMRPLTLSFRDPLVPIPGFQSIPNGFLSSQKQGAEEVMDLPTCAVTGTTNKPGYRPYTALNPKPYSLSR